MFRKFSRIFIVLLIAVLLRFLFSYGLPLGAEEIGVATLQATGQAHDFYARLSEDVVPISEVQQFIRYSSDYSAIDVVLSMRTRGMHPPLFYLLTHYVLKYFGTAGMVLRLIPILVSVVSIVYLYRLSRVLFDERAAFWAAAFLALSGYGIWLGNYVRPYSLVMMFSLISTYQMHCLIDKGDFLLKNRNIWFYVLTVLLGLYTIYHFVFVFVFQLAWGLLHNYRNKTYFQTMFIVIVVVFIGYLPWVPSILVQLKVVRSEEFYFHEQVDLLRFFGEAVAINFFRYFPIQAFSWKIILALISAAWCGAPAIWGCRVLLGDKKKRLFLIALLIYILSYCLVEMALGLSTFHKIKMLFFVMPVLFMFWAVGFCRLSPRLGQWVLLLFCLSLLVNSSAGLVYPTSRLGGHEGYLFSFPAKINYYSTSGANSLVLMNYAESSNFFPLVNMLDSGMKFKILNQSNLQEQVDNICTQFAFDTIIFVYLDTPTVDSWPDDVFPDIREYFQQHGYGLHQEYEQPYEDQSRTLLIFKKN